MSDNSRFHCVGSSRARKVSRGGVGLAPCARREQLSPNLWRDLRVRLRAQHCLETLLLLDGDLSFVMLCKREEGLLPQHGRYILAVGKPRKVLDERIDDAVGKRVFFAQQRSQKQR